MTQAAGAVGGEHAAHAAQGATRTGPVDGCMGGLADLHMASVTSAASIAFLLAKCL